MEDLRTENTARVLYFALALYMPWILSVRFICWQTCAAVPWGVFRRMLPKSTFVSKRMCGNPCLLPQPPLGYLRWLEQFFYRLMPTHVSFIHVLMCLNCVQNLKGRVHAAFISKDDPEQKSFGAISLRKHVSRWISTARCCIYILY